MRISRVNAGLIMIGVLILFASLTLAFIYSQIAHRGYYAEFREALRQRQHLYHWIKDPGVIRAYMNAHPVRKLQLGAGGNDPGDWLNTDIEPNRNEVYLDATGRYPFPDGSFQYILSEHVIEHVPWEEGLAMLKECHRVLASGGQIRIVTPNLMKLFQLLTGPIDEAQRGYIVAKLRLHPWPVTPVTGAYIFNHEVRDWGHRFLYDSATLRKTFELAGFNRVTEYPVEEKTDSVFKNAELRTRNPGSDLFLENSWEAMAFEAVR